MAACAFIFSSCLCLSAALYLATRSRAAVSASAADDDAKVDPEGNAADLAMVDPALDMGAVEDADEPIVPDFCRAAVRHRDATNAGLYTCDDNTQTQTDTHTHKTL